MKKIIQKLFALILSSFMIFSNIAPAFATNGSDSEETMSNDSVVRLDESVDESTYHKQHPEGEVNALSDSFSEGVDYEIIDDQLIIKEGVSEIPNHAFSDMTGISSVILPKSLKKIGDYAFNNMRLKSLSFEGEDLILGEANFNAELEIGEYAFRDNDFEKVNFKNVKIIKKGAFSNNELTDITFDDSILEIGDRAFYQNDLTELKIPNSVNVYGNEIFFYNNRYVKLITDNKNVKSELSDVAYGSVLNPVTVTVKFIDKETGDNIIEDKILGVDFTDKGSVFELGKENTYKVPDLDGFTKKEDFITFSPDNVSYTITAYYSSKDPEIKMSSKVFHIGDTIDEKALLEGVVATDAFGNDISDNITVNPKSLPSDKKGVFDITYKVVDNDGRESTKTFKISIISDDYSDVEIGGGWTVGDFTYLDKDVPKEYIDEIDNNLKDITEDDKDAIIKVLSEQGIDVNGKSFDELKNLYRNLIIKEEEKYLNERNKKRLKQSYIDSIQGIYKEFDYRGDGIPLNIDDVFSYPKEDENIITGFSESGLKKLEGNKNVVLPGIDIKGRKIVSVASDLSNDDSVGFSGKQIENLDFSNMSDLKYIHYASFRENKLKRVDLSPLQNLEVLGNNAFYVNEFKKVEILNLNSLKYIGSYIFGNNVSYDPNINEEYNVILKNLPNLEVTSGPIYHSSHINNIVVENLPKLERLTSMLVYSRGALNNTSLILKDLPNLKYLDSQIFVRINIKNLEIKNLSSLEKIESSFYENNIENLTLENLPKLKTITTKAFSNNKLKDVYFKNIPNLESVKDSFSDNPGNPDYKKVVIWADDVSYKAFVDNNIRIGADYIVNPKDNTDISNEFTDGDFSYIKLKNGYVITGLTANGLKKLNKNNGVLTIDGKSFDRKIISIDKESFIDYSIKELTISNMTELSEITRDSFKNVGLEKLTLFNLPNLEYLGGFNENKLETVKMDGLPKVRILGENAFYKNNLKDFDFKKLPNLKRLNYKAFDSNKLTKINFNDLSNVDFFGIDVFRNNLLESADLTSLTKINSISGGFLRNNRLKSINIKDMKNIDVISHHAFFDNLLTEVDFTGLDNLKEIKMQAFDYNHISDINLNVLPSLDTVGTRTFGGNKFTTVKVPNSLKDLHLRTFEGNVGVNSKKQVAVITPESKNLNNLKDSNSHIIDPTFVEISYVDENGNNLLEKESFLASGKSYTAKAKHIDGYKKPDDITATEKDNTISIVFKYEKYSNAELKIFRDNSSKYSLSHTTEKNKHYITDTMISNLTFDLSGYSAEGVPIIRLKFDPNVYDMSKINVKANTIKDIVDADKIKINKEMGTVDIPFKNVAGGSSVTIPITWAFKKYVTPENEKFNIETYLYSSKDDTRPLAILNDLYFEGYYKRPYLKKYYKNSENSLITNFLEYSDPNLDTEDKNKISVSPYEKAVYNFSLYNLERNLSHGKIVDYLPTYTDKDGNKKLAVFKSEENPGWVLSEDGKSVIYESEISNENRFKISNLVLHYPYAKLNSNIENKVEAILTPFNKGSKEDVMTVNASRKNYYNKVPAPTGDILLKTIRKPHPNVNDVKSAYFYDIDSEKKLFFPWKLFVNMGKIHDADKVIIKDHKLDKRHFYEKIEVESVLKGSVLELFDRNGKVLEKTILSDTTYNIPEDIKYDVRSFDITVVDKEALKKHTTVTSYTKLIDPNIEYFDKNNKPLSDVSFYNTLTVKAYKGKEEIFNKDSITNLVIRPSKARIHVVKYGSTKGPVDSNSEIVYTLGYYKYDTFEEITKDFEVIDLLPKGMNVKKVELLEPFKSAKNARCEFVPNYKDGRDAVIFRASELIDGVKPWDRRGIDFSKIAKLYTEVTPFVTNGNFTNDVYLRVGNDKVTYVNEKTFNNEIYSHADHTASHLRAKAVIARKDIREIDENGNPKEWTSGIITKLGAKFDYRLSVLNLSEKDVENLEILDKLPHKNDTSMVENQGGEKIERGSLFNNYLDINRDVKVLLNNEKDITNDFDITYSTDGKTFTKAKSENIKYVKAVAKNGFKLQANSSDSVSMLIPMRAPKLGDVQWDNSKITEDIFGKKAYNTFTRKDSGSNGKELEVNRVYNEIYTPRTSVVFKKYGYNWKSSEKIEKEVSEQKSYATAKAYTLGKYNEWLNFLSDDDLKSLYLKNYSETKDTNTMKRDLKALYEKNLPKSLEDIKGNLRDLLIKLDKFPLEGATFRVIKANGEFVGDFKSNKDGVVNIDNLPITDDYVIKEVSTGKDFKLSDKEIFVSKEDLKNAKNNLLKLDDFINEPIIPEKYADISFIKCMADGITPFPNRKFKLTSKDSDKVYESTSDDKGLVEFIRVPEGKYELTEVKLLDNVAVDYIKKEVIINEPNQKIDLGKIVNDKFNLTISKLSVLDDKKNKKLGTFNEKDGVSLTGAKFELKEGSKVIETITMKDSKYVFKNLKADTLYTLSEISAPDRHKIMYKDIKFKFSKDGKLLDEKGNELIYFDTLFIPNLREDDVGSLVVKKLDDENNPLENVEFTLFKENDGKYVEFKKNNTNNEGLVEFSDLPFGKYKIVETKGINGFINRSFSEEFTVKRYFDLIKKQSFSYEVINPKFDFDIRKVDELGNPLEGVQFNIVRKTDEKVVETIVSDSEGELNLNKDLYSSSENYRIDEVKAPYGFEENKIGWNLNLKDLSKNKNFDGHINLKLVNKSLKGKAIISKYSFLSKKRYNKAEFALAIKDGNKFREIDRKMTDESGFIEFDDLEIGKTYKIYETDPGLGYKLNKEEKVFTITEGERVFRYTFYNFPIDLPQTGSTILILSVGSIFILMFSFGYGAVKKLKNKI